MSKPTVTKNNEQSVTVEMPNTQGSQEVYSVFYPDPSNKNDAWVKVQRSNSGWAMLNGRSHQRQIRNVLAAIEAA